MRHRLAVEYYGVVIGRSDFPEQWAPTYGVLLAYPWDGKLRLFRAVGMTTDKLIVLLYEKE